MKKKYHLLAQGSIHQQLRNLGYIGEISAESDTSMIIRDYKLPTLVTKRLIDKYIPTDQVTTTIMVLPTLPYHPYLLVAENKTTEGRRYDYDVNKPSIVMPLSEPAHNEMQVMSPEQLILPFSKGIIIESPLHNQWYMYDRLVGVNQLFFNRVHFVENMARIYMEVFADKVDHPLYEIAANWQKTYQKV